MSFSARAQTTFRDGKIKTTELLTSEVLKPANENETDLSTSMRILDETTTPVATTFDSLTSQDI